jgi:gluconate 2-dehydrogenase gamma chain
MISRRDLLKQMGVAGAVAVASSASAQQRPASPARQSFDTLTPAEGEVLEAAVARIIPSDESGPGAKEAGAAHYIDQALAGPLSGSRAAYTSGLAALDTYARSSKGAPFAALTGADQDAVLADVEANRVAGTGPGFFLLLRAHTIEGTFADPVYGGNTNFAGWDLIGYPGVRVSVSPAEQQLNVAVPPNHKSAYDFGMFNKQK